MASFLIEIIGWVGASFVLLAFLLLETKRLGSTSKSYLSMNIVGAVLITINSYINNALPSVGLNIVWIGIAVYGLRRRPDHGGPAK